MNDTLAKLKREKGVITRVLNAEEVDKLKATGEFSLLPTVSLKKYVEEAYKIDSTKGFSYAYMKNGSLFYARVARFTLSQKNHSKNYLEFNAKGIKSSDVYQERCYDIFNYTSAYGIDAMETLLKARNTPVLLMEERHVRDSLLYQRFIHKPI